jgi:hypothetical protein
MWERNFLTQMGETVDNSRGPHMNKLMATTATPYLDSKYRVRSVQYLTLLNINCAKTENRFTFLRVPF